MAEPGHRRTHRRRRRENPGMNRAWCCSFGVVLQSHENRGAPVIRRSDCGQEPPLKPRKPSSASSFHSSPSPSSKMSLGFMDPRRMLSPGRVSPIDSDATFSVSAAVTLESDQGSVDPPPKSKTPILPARLSASSTAAELANARPGSEDLTLTLKGKNGKSLVLKLDAEVLCQSSKFFAAMVLDDRRKASGTSQGSRKIEIAEIEDLSVFKDTVELMYEKDAIKGLLKAGVSRSIDILEVSSSIMFNRGVASCLRYLEAAPWSEDEEQKLKGLFWRRSFDDPIVHDVLGRLYGQVPGETQDLAMRLVRSVIDGRNGRARKELQTLVSCLISRSSSVYQKKPAGLSKEALYGTCSSCFASLKQILREAGDTLRPAAAAAPPRPPAIERVSGEVDSLTWLLDILIEQQMAEDFVKLWAEQGELIRLHGAASPMVRYEISRVSAAVFTAMGTAKLQCTGEVREAVIGAWFGPFLADFAWLRRRGDGAGDPHPLLPQQQAIFLDWFARFSDHGHDCPNLSRTFEVWWRRSYQAAAASPRCRLLPPPVVVSSPPEEAASHRRLLVGSTTVHLDYRSSFRFG
ncbi:unnamed protein product [Spirodela intermedia]|uniref:BTB domain-containing protein n=1 Tax=Spirodela intermedia TaxID=51605 RepID=A0A7I8IT95_SPIIN|nr:unnamed protein product [Spirodela intermedia]CAA6660365.1 unnamed protein product [Spirodela intermedia]